MTSNNKKLNKVENTKIFGIIRRMKDIYPMWKLCRFFLENESAWQNEELTTKIILNTTGGWDDNSVGEERMARTFKGENKGRTKTFLAMEYIKNFYPQYTELSEAFGSLLKLDPKDKDASEKPAEIIKIIDNCLAEKYKFLDQDKNDLEIIYLNAEGRDFVNPPYFRPFYNKEWSFGLLKAYVKAIGPVWQIIIIIITALIGFIFGKLQ